MVTKPPRLKKGDTVAVVSPSWGGPFDFPHIYENGIRVLKDIIGLKVKEFLTTRADADYIYRNPRKRAEDVTNAFLDPEVDAIFCSIGGDDSVRILPYIEEEAIANNPKIVMGFSDITTILTYFNQLGLVTLYGPMVMAGFSQLEALPPSFHDHVEVFLFAEVHEYPYHPYESYCNGYLDWSQVENTGKIKELHKNTGFQWLQGEGIINGKLFGGCIEVLEFMKGTDFWPEPDFWENKILFLETSEQKPSPAQVKWMLRNYGMQGVFDKVTALLFGRAMDYTKEEKNQLDECIVSVVSEEFERPDLPVVSNMDFGHTNPQFIVPLGVECEIDCENKTVKLCESPFS